MNCIWCLWHYSPIECHNDSQHQPSLEQTDQTASQMNHSLAYPTCSPYPSCTSGSSILGKNWLLTHCSQSLMFSLFVCLCLNCDHLCCACFNSFSAKDVLLHFLWCGTEPKTHYCVFGFYCKKNVKKKT